jgi:hypothetical protein
MSDLITAEGKVPKQTFKANFNNAILDELWGKLDIIRSAAILRYGSGNRAYSTSETISNFFRKWKKGSRKVRFFLKTQKHI